MEVLKLGETDYPYLLSQISDPPQCLFIKGSLIRRLNRSDNLTIAIVGARQSTSHGRRIAYELAKSLSELGLTIISGLAEGIDAAAHEGALKGKGKTIAVLGCGLNVIYPAVNYSLYKRIAREGSLVTEYSLNTRPQAWHFPARNRIISGLSRGVIVVEGKEKSGALITADFALEQGREVFAVPGSIKNSLSRAPHKLLKEGACLIENIFDIIEELNLNRLDLMQNIFNEEQSKNSVLKNLSNDEKEIFMLIEKSPVQLDEIICQTGLKISKINSILSALELKGLIKQDANNFYRKI